METDNLRETQGNIRTVIYIKLNFNYTRYKKYECKDESTITISIGYNKEKRIFSQDTIANFNYLKKEKNQVP